VLDLNPETVQFIIDRAHEFQFGDESSNPEEEPSLDQLSEDDLTHEVDDPTYLELKTAIDDLEPDQQVSLVALMWLGRGDYSLDEWANALERAGESWNERSADYLIRTPLLADYLSEGLAQFTGEETS